jgi:hypothetical protein
MLSFAVLGGPLPNYDSDAAAEGVYPAGTQPQSAPAASASPTPSSGAGPAPSIQVFTFPNAAVTSGSAQPQPITGQGLNLPTGRWIGTYDVVMYLQGADGTWWCVLVMLLFLYCSGWVVRATNLCCYSCP